MTNIGVPEFPHPFNDRDDDWDTPPAPSEEMPRLYNESRMMDLSWTLRQKPNWVEKIKDLSILAKWRNEALDQQKSVVWERRLTENMIEYVLKELESYAKLRDTQTGIEHACDDSVFRSFQLIPEDLTHALRAEVAKLEDVPDDKKDWHPNSNQQVLNLVHPSLYPIVYGRTLVRDLCTPDKAQVIPPPLSSSDSWFYSKKFCWLPSDFSIANDGTATLISPYINNVEPTRTELMDTVTRIVGRFVPLWERVLGAIDRRDRPNRETGYDSEPVMCPQRIIGGGSQCIWTESPNEGIYNETWDESQYLGWPGATADERRREWLRWKSGQGDKYLGIEMEGEEDSGQYERDIKLPDAPPPSGFNFALEKSWRVANLKGKTVQVIVKLANIQLTPENPAYAGGRWHVEAMLNERIVSTGIYYYDCENVTDSHLAFRTCVKTPEDHDQDDFLCMEWLYDLDRDQELVQSRGQVPTLESTCLAFPNIYQHCVSPFKLADPTKPGHRKILALFLVDPNHPIPSATTVLPQQEEWTASSLHSSATEAGHSLIDRLPMELKDLIVAQTEGLMSRQEAETFRLELMEERRKFVTEYESKVVNFSFDMCDH